MAPGVRQCLRAAGGTDMEALALLLAATLNAGTVLAIAGLGLLINERPASSTSAPRA